MLIIYVSDNYVISKNYTTNICEYYSINNIEKNFLIPFNNNPYKIKHKHYILNNINLKMDEYHFDTCYLLIEKIVKKIIETNNQEIIIINKKYFTKSVNGLRDLIFDKKILDLNLLINILNLSNKKYYKDDVITSPYSIINHWEGIFDNLFSNEKFIIHNIKLKYFSTINENLYGLYRIFDHGITINNKKYNLLYGFSSNNGRPRVEGEHYDIDFNNISKNEPVSHHLVSRFKNGRIVEIDYRAYSIIILSKLIDYKFPENSYPYNIIGRLLYNRPNKLSKKEIEKIKTMTFEILFGNSKKYEGIENIGFFNKMIGLKHSLWNIYNKKHIIPMAERIPMNDVTNKGTLLNYVFTGLETIYNIVIINEIVNYMESKSMKSKLIMYKYDSFVFDFDESEYKKYVGNILSIIKLNGDVRLCYGKSYGEMEEVGNF